MRLELNRGVHTGSLPLVLIITFNFIALSYCQFISHFAANGLKGNISFSIRESILVIDSYIESNQHLETGKLLEDESQQILFDWNLYSNHLEPYKLASCSDEDVGSPILDNLKQSISEGKSIILNKPNQWTMPLKILFESNSVSSLSSLIWAKSLRLKLSPIYKEPIEKQALDGPVVAAAGGGGGLSRPSLQGPIVQPTPQTSPKKPTFAPRPKPSISDKSKTSTSLPPTLPKPQSLVLENNSTTNNADTIVPSTPKPNDEVKKAFNRRILQLYGKSIVCGNIIDTRNVKTVEAIFESPIVSGDVILRGNEDGVTLISTNLYQLKSKVTTRHDWKILTSDILDNRRHEDECKYLQLLFDPDNIEDSQCKRNDTSKCKMGDLTKKHGQIQVAGLGKSTETNFVDLNLPLSFLEGGSRSLFLVLYVTNSKQDRMNILSCAKIKPLIGRKVEATFNMDGVRGSIRISQRYITEPATISYDLFGLEGNVRHQTIRELPLMIRTSSDNSKLCNYLGEVFNANNKFVHGIRIGNLSARHGPLAVIDSEYEDHYMGEYLDLSLQLYGRQTVAGRSIVIHKNNGDSWVCATLEYVDEPIILAVARFHYPVVGQISFQQLARNANSETGVLIEVYNPNSDKNSDGHDWLIHLEPAMADFYNWSERCQSSGDVFDPMQAATTQSKDLYTRQCLTSISNNEPLRCRLGDVSTKSGFKLSLMNSYLNRTRLFYNDPYLPLTKLNSIIGRSVVIYDENSPTQRGNRLACSTIKSVHPLKASIRTWNSGPSIPSAVLGSVVFEQESALKATKININLSGFNGNVEHYAIHNVWTMDDKEFPCSNDSLYDIYDPFDSENSSRLPPSAHYGLSATVDRVKVGDMSRKHGTFEGLQGVQKFYLDANAPLFASKSIIGRSMVLRAAVNDFRWVCGNIELDYDKGESREIIAVASFDDPRSKIAGYVRFVQLEHKDGSLSDTFVHVDLKMQSDGGHELQTSDSHNWAIFVNQVGADAFIVADDVRCIASGFKWNPYLAQDNSETYANSCNPSEQLACAMGDLGMRHGQLTLGPNNRRSLSDSNLPLVGNYSIMGRSLIIFDNKRPSIKLACANIFPDIHLKTNVVIKRTPSFTVARFVEQMRDLLGAAEWLIVPELRATKPVANGECVQMTIHFYGQKAHQFQIELNNLITLGTVRKSTRDGVDKISTHYKLCRAGQMQLTSSATTCSITMVGQLLISFLLTSTSTIVLIKMF